MKRQRSRGRTAPAVVAALCAAALSAVAALPAQAWAAGTPSPYAFEPSAKPVRGTEVNTDAEQLTAGETYKDSIKPGGKLFYRVSLDAKSNAYVSATAVPGPGTKVAYADELKVTLQDRDSRSCSYDSAQFNAEFARPIGTYASRTMEKGSTSCQSADTYYVLIERTSAATSSSEPWDLEIRHVTEPALSGGGPTAAPENWPSASPAPPAGGVRDRKGGTSFFNAPGLEEGEWRDRIKPGETRFYKVPVDWGQQLFASADLSSSTGEGYVPSALAVSLYNPARGLVDSDNNLAYDGKPKSAELDPLPPVAYENRYASKESVNTMRFAGWYYLRVSLNPAVEKPFGAKALGLTLRLNVDGEAKQAPAYAGSAGEFQVTGDDRDQAASGQSTPGAQKSDTMRLVGVGGIGAGTALVLGLGGWMLVARRRAAGGAGGGGAGSGPGPGPGSGPPSQYGPPAGW